MLIDRRIFLTGTAALLGLAGCKEPEATVLSVKASGSGGMNRGPDGADRPVTLTILQMRGSGAFDGSDYFALQNPSAALGGDLVKADQIVLAPGGTATSMITVEAGTTVIGVTAGFRDPAGKQFRGKVSAPAASAGLMISVGPGGVKLQLA